MSAPGNQPRRHVGRWIFGGCFVALVVAILYPVFAPVHSGRTNSCLRNLTRLYEGLEMYNEENGALPPAVAWMDGIAKYIGSDMVFHCPSAVRDNPYVYGYAVRRRLGGTNLRVLGSPKDEPLVFDSFPIGRNARTDVALIPGFSRHGGQNIAYADGHLRFIRTAAAKPASNMGN